eukprot:7739732-Karenia_brevis.AAC.1
MAYDIRISPLDALEPILVEHANALRDVVTKLSDVQLSECQWSRLQLPGPLGGMGLRTALASADAAF